MQFWQASRQDWVNLQGPPLVCSFTLQTVAIGIDRSYVGHLFKNKKLLKLPQSYVICSCSQNCSLVGLLGFTPASSWCFQSISCLQKCLSCVGAQFLLLLIGMSCYYHYHQKMEFWMCAWSGGGRV